MILSNVINVGIGFCIRKEELMRINLFSMRLFDLFLYFDFFMIIYGGGVGGDLRVVWKWRQCFFCGDFLYVVMDSLLLWFSMV